MKTEKAEVSNYQVYPNMALLPEKIYKVPYDI